MLHLVLLFLHYDLNLLVEQFGKHSLGPGRHFGEHVDSGIRVRDKAIHGK